jgi:hypothetical protein
MEEDLQDFLDLHDEEERDQKILKARNSGKVAAQKYVDDADIEELAFVDVRKNQVLPSKLDLQRDTASTLNTDRSYA